MAPSSNDDNRSSTAGGTSSISTTSNRPSSDADLAQAYRDLTRGEQAATALEADLSKLEGKLDAFLAALGDDFLETATPASSEPAKPAKGEANGKADDKAGKQFAHHDDDDNVTAGDAAAKGDKA